MVLAISPLPRKRKKAKKAYQGRVGSFPPPARFGPGPAIHFEDVGSFDDGSLGVVGTAHIYLWNPDTGFGPQRSPKTGH